MKNDHFPTKLDPSKSIVLYFLVFGLNFKVSLFEVIFDKKLIIGKQLKLIYEPLTLEVLDIRRKQL